MNDLFHTRSASFDSPIEMMKLCHEKVRRFARLTQRLGRHMEKSSIDAAAKEAAESVLRYFTIAAPLHHEDEEDDLFPALRNLSIERLGVTEHEVLHRNLQELEAEHVQLTALWHQIATWLNALLQDIATPPPQCLNTFAITYTAHADREEKYIYPYAEALAPVTLNRIGQRMAKRRTLTQVKHFKKDQ